MAKESKGKQKDQANLDNILKNAVMGEVCTRFPPEPSGYLHIGHTKAAMLNFHYAKHYNGTFLVRFDDTNPSKEKMEFEESILADLSTLGIIPDRVSHSSDYFERLESTMEELLKKGETYADKTDVETMRKERDTGVESKYRSQDVEENLRLWREMLAGSEEGRLCCVRGRMDMKCKNKCLRDPVFYRCKCDIPHHRTGLKHKAYPTYDFACPLLDAWEGVTHAMRTIEYKDRAGMYTWVLKVTDSRHVEMVEFAKTQFTFTTLSKRKLTWFVEQGLVQGWNDPRFPTVQGVLRRGMTVEALKDFVMTQGMSKATTLMEWDKIWAINKQKIDPVVPRYAAVNKEGAVLFKLSDGPKEEVAKKIARHQKNESLGEKLLIQYHEIWLEKDDASLIENGEEITLLHWGNAIAEEVSKNESGDVVEIAGRLNLEGDVKKTKKKVHWVSNVQQTTLLILRELDHLVTKPRFEEEDKVEDFINPASQIDTEAIGEPGLKTLAKGDSIQLERRGYFIADSLFCPPSTPMVLIKIPDGKKKDVSGVKSKVDPSKLQGGGGKEPKVKS